MEREKEKMFFDDAAKSWDTPERTERAQAVAKAMSQALGLESGVVFERALEFGCGTGLVSFFLKDSFEQIHLVDTSAGMIEVLREKIAAGQLMDKMRPELLDLTKPDAKAGPYDVIFTSMALHHVKEVEPLLERFYEMLADKGRLCVVELDLDAGGFHAEAPDFEGHHGFDQQAFKHMMNAAGFEGVSASTFFKGTRQRKGKLEPYGLFVIEGKKIPRR